MSNILWSRQETMRMSGLTRGQFQGFEKLNILSPMKIGDLKKPTVLFTWEQILIIRAYAKLRANCSVRSLKQALEYLKPLEASDLLRDKRLVAYQNCIYWVDTDEELKTVLQVSGKNQGQFIMTFTIQDLDNEAYENGKKGNVVDFEERYRQATEKAKAA